MIYVAIHYRLSTDKNPGLQGCWKEFSSDLKANRWLSERVLKTRVSPRGKYCKMFKDLNEVPEKYSDWEWDWAFPESSACVSLQRSIMSYINYCNRKKKMLDDAKPQQ